MDPRISNSAALIDNTTIHGAIAAYQSWPPAASSWTRNPYAVNLRSLMDIIEATVLFDTIYVDGACGSLEEPAADEPRYGSAHEWEPFESLADPRTEKRIFELDYFTSDVRIIGAGILATAAETLRKHIADGLIQRQAHLFSTNQAGLAVPRFYRGAAQFTELLRETVAPEALFPIVREIDALESMLEGQPQEVANFAMFAFRGFYYSELAHILSLSYIPHSFRSGVLAQVDHVSRATFARLALDTVGSLRQEYIAELGAQISSQLNSELDGPSFGVNLPLIASYVASQVDRRSDLMPAALEVRNSPSVRRFRQWVSRVQSAIDEQARLQIIRDAGQELNDLAGDLRRELQIVRAPSTEVTLKLAVPTGVVGVDIPVAVRAGLPEWLKRMLHRRPHLKFLRDLALSGVEFAPFELAYRTLPA